MHAAILTSIVAVSLKISYSEIFIYIVQKSDPVEGSWCLYIQSKAGGSLD